MAEHFKDIIEHGSGWIAATIAFVTFIISLRSVRKSIDYAHYTELDKLYFDLLKLRIENPEIQLPAKTAAHGGDNGLRHYSPQQDTYAYIVANFIETILDRCERAKRHRLSWLPFFKSEYERSSATWRPVIQFEYPAIAEWLEAGGNVNRFKPDFQNQLNEALRSERSNVTA